MKRVRIIVPFDGFAVGDEPEFHGHVARKHVADGRAVDIEELPEDDQAAAKPRRRNGKGRS